MRNFNLIFMGFVVGLSLGIWLAEYKYAEYLPSGQSRTTSKGTKPVVTEVQGMDASVKYTFDNLLNAIEFVESGGDANAVGDNGKAVGAYQIHKIYVDDVNRILQEDHLYKHEISPEISPVFTYGDRLDKAKSRQMTRIYLRHYGKSSYHYGNGDMYYYGVVARIHNGGPKGHLKESTKPYWQKVKARMEESK